MARPHVGVQLMIGQETETGHGWSYEVSLRWPDGGESRAAVSLSWADHDRISRGLHPPSAVVRAALRLVLESGESAPLNSAPRLDLSTLRRRIEGFDDAVRERLE